MTKITTITTITEMIGCHGHFGPVYYDEDIVGSPSSEDDTSERINAHMTMTTCNKSQTAREGGFRRYDDDFIVDNSSTSMKYNLNNEAGALATNTHTLTAVVMEAKKEKTKMTMIQQKR